MESMRYFRNTKKPLFSKKISLWMITLAPFACLISLKSLSLSCVSNRSCIHFRDLTEVIIPKMALPPPKKALLFQSLFGLLVAPLLPRPRLHLLKLRHVSMKLAFFKSWSVNNARAIPPGCAVQRKRIADHLLRARTNKRQ